MASNWRADSTLRDYLVRHSIVAISDIDTRALTRVLRSTGVMRGIIATGDVDPRRLVEAARASRRWRAPIWCAASPAQRRSTGGPTHSTLRRVLARRRSVAPVGPLKIAAYDYGMKWNILRRFTAHGCDVRVFPADAPASDLLGEAPDGVFLSNGPGDPAALDYAVENARELVKADVAGLRHLPRTPDPVAGAGRRDLQAEVRPSGREPSGQGARDRQDRDHFAESRLRGRRRIAAVGRASHARQPVRRDRRGAASRDQAGLLRAVPSRSGARSARCGLPVPAVPGRDGKARLRRGSRL